MSQPGPGLSLTAQAERERRQREAARAAVAAASGSAAPGHVSGAGRSSAAASAPSISAPPRAAIAIAPAAAADALTRLEVNRAAARSYSAGEASSYTDDASLVGRLYIDDPVWGRWIHNGPPGSRPACCPTMCCLQCCPCCVPPLMTPARRAARARVYRTSAFWLSVIQISLVIVSLSFRGFAPYEVNFGLGPWVDTLDFLGAKNGAKIIRLREAWRLIVAIMLHNGLLHLATNLLMQVRLGILAEITWGTRRFFPLYIGAGVMGSLFSTVVIPNAIGVGASGALCGVLGAWITFLALHWGHGTEAMQQNRKREIMMTALNVLILFATSFIPNIDWAAHLGGLVGGVLIAGWYFGPALGGEAFAFDTLSRAAAERKVAAAARALAAADGAAAPALPSRLRGTVRSVSPPQSAPLVDYQAARSAGSPPPPPAGGVTWGGTGRRLDGRENADAAKKASCGEACCVAMGVALDEGIDIVCSPMPNILAAFSADAPRGLLTGALVSICSLITFFALASTLLGLIYGGYLSTDPSLLNVCPILQLQYPLDKLKCPY